MLSVEGAFTGGFPSSCHSRDCQMYRVLTSSALCHAIPGEPDQGDFIQSHKRGSAQDFLDPRPVLNVSEDSRSNPLLWRLVGD